MNSKKKYLEFLVAAGIFAVITIVLCVVLAKLDCGWHFVDDHEFLEIGNMLNKGESVSQVIKFWNDKDVVMGRFRPIYYPVRIIATVILGEDLAAHAAIKLIETLVTLILLYCLGRDFGAGFASSTAFALVALLGYQSPVFWKLGPQEIQGVMFFAAGMVLLMRRRKHLIFGIGSMLCFFIMALYKESFILMLPFVFLFLIYDNNKNEESLKGVITNIKGLKTDAGYLAASAAMFIGLIGFIVLKIGTNGYSGAGISSSIHIGQIIDSYAWARDHDLRWLYSFGILFIFLLLTFWSECRKSRKEFILALSIILPQLVLYGKEAMSERYILPMSVGYALLFMVFPDAGNILKWKRKRLYQLLVVGLLLLSFRTAAIEADYYRFRGQSITVALEYMKDVINNDGRKAVSCYGYSNPEADVTIKNYLQYYSDPDMCSYWSENAGGIIKEPPFGNDDTNVLPLDDYDIIEVYNTGDRHYTGRPALVADGLLDEDFEEVRCGTVTIYVRRDCGLEIPEFNIKNAFYYEQ